MDLILTRKQFLDSGIFSDLTDSNGNLIAKCGEHSYAQGPLGVWRPKVSDGVYTCLRGQHQLAGMTAPFETFMLASVPNHTNILFHVGNFPQKDSEGCILLGESMGMLAGDLAVLNSKEAFAAFMVLQAGTDNFQLTVAT